MSTRSEPTPWNDIETLLDLVRVEEEALLAVMEALGELEDPNAEEFPWDEFNLEDFPPDERPQGDLPPGELPWGDVPMNVIHN